jgi:hypothetical protein
LFVISFDLKTHQLATWSKELFGNFLEKLPHFEKENYEIVKFPSFDVSIFI